MRKQIHRLCLAPTGEMEDVVCRPRTDYRNFPETATNGRAGSRTACASVVFAGQGLSALAA
jgi:hypothetical protein